MAVVRSDKRKSAAAKRFFFAVYHVNGTVPEDQEDLIKIVAMQYLALGVRINEPAPAARVFINVPFREKFFCFFHGILSLNIIIA